MVSASRAAALLAAAALLFPAMSSRADDPSPSNGIDPPPAGGGTPPAPHYDGLDTIYESLFGNAYAEPSDWHPLPLSTLFTEGWDEAFVNPPAGSGGAPRSGWINAFDGTFFRAWFLVFAYQRDLQRNGDGFLGSYTIYAPMNRRLEFRVDVPFVVANRAGPDNAYHSHFGDLTVAPRVLLSATRDFSQLFVLNVRTPTGSALNASGVTAIGPQYQFWYNPFGNWAVRGGTGVHVPTNQAGSRTGYLADLAVGRYWKGEENGWVRHAWVYLAANLNTPLGGSGPRQTFLGLTPGMRVQITGYWFFLAGVEVPVVGPKPFDYAPIFLLLKDY